MPTRRKFLKQAVSLGIAAAAAPSARAATSPLLNAIGHPGSSIKRVIRRDETILRLGGIGDDFWITWTADDRQFIAVEDGVGWMDNPSRWFNGQLWAITGGPQNATFEHVSTYPDLAYPIGWVRPYTQYYPFGTLAVDGGIYQYLALLSQPNDSPSRWIGAKLIYSPDNGRTWHNQDGSSPVVWESADKSSPAKMAFFRESQEAFSMLSFLQMGRNYEANRDGYVYVYSQNGNTDGTMNQLVMFRVPKAQIIDRSAYEYFTGLEAHGMGTWSKDIRARGIVHTFPRGWVNTGVGARELITEAWLPSVTYNAPLGLYMMANWGHGSASDGTWFGKPSYLGLWVALNPWGPWTQIHEETAWTPGGDIGARCYTPQISPKWISADGKSFWIVWTDFQNKRTKAELDRLNDEEAPHAATAADFTRLAGELRVMQPYYSFNAQRFDLITT